MTLPAHLDGLRELLRALDVWTMHDDEPIPGFTLSTGSGPGMALWAATAAEAIAEGMVGKSAVPLPAPSSTLKARQLVGALLVCLDDIDEGQGETVDGLGVSRAERALLLARDLVTEMSGGDDAGQS